MVEIDDIQASVREHLLGRVKGEEREPFEEKFLTDPEFREAVLLIEEELIDDYTAGLLSEADRESFIKQYVNAPGRKPDVQFTALLRDAALQDRAIQTAGSRTITAQPRPSKSSRLPVFRRERWIPWLATGALVLAGLLMFWSGIASWIWRDRIADVNAEVALLNKQPPGNQPSFPVALRLIENRSPENEQKVLIPSGTSVVELRCPLPNGSYGSYQATLRVVNDGEVFAVDKLQAEDAGDGKTLPLRIPARLLTPQDYIFTVKGLTADGRLEDVADYFFRIVK
jgi:hypothetical protein